MKRAATYDRVTRSDTDTIEEIHPMKLLKRPKIQSTPIQPNTDKTVLETFKRLKKEKKTYFNRIEEDANYIGIETKDVFDYEGILKNTARIAREFDYVRRNLKGKEIEIKREEVGDMRKRIVMNDINDLIGHLIDGIDEVCEFVNLFEIKVEDFAYFNRRSAEIVAKKKRIFK